ncbi:hypothetical protein ANO14919_094380 [Xylariales sp. No.14919]|nr:hypothetical protein ANO14919_094380 [Xylariales sp. No.14919]
MGPLNPKLDRCCADCGQPRSSFCGREWVRGSCLDIPPPHDQEPHLEALPIHAPHNYTSGATTPLDNAGSVISKIRLTKSPLLPPYLLHQTHSTSAGTDTAIRASTQSETSAQQSHELASGQWAADRGRSDLIPVPIHEPLHHPSSYNDTSSALPNGSPRYLASLYQLIAQSDSGHSGHSGSGVDYSIHHSSEITGSAVGVLQNTRSQAEPATRAKRKYVAVDDIASDASAPNSADGSAQACAIPTLPGGIPLNIIPSGWPNSLHDVSVPFPADSQIPSPSFRLSPLAWISDDNCDYTTLSQPQLHLIDCDPLELPPPQMPSR